MNIVKHIIKLLAIVALIIPVKSQIPPVKIGCYDSTLRLKILNLNGKMVSRSCEWVGRKFSKKRCALNDGAVAAACPVACGTCDVCEDPPSGKEGVRFRFDKDGTTLRRSCEWVTREATRLRCFLTGNICRKTCGSCVES